MSGHPGTVVWITGATQGVGAALAASVPFADARVVNISRRQHPDLESVRVDLTDPESWDRVAQVVAADLLAFRGERALFVHNAVHYGTEGPVGELDPADYRSTVLANVAAPLVLGEAFVRACPPGLDSGLVLMSSAVACSAMAGFAVYGAAKAGVEQWVRAVRAERRRAGTGPWVTAVRPGFVVTEEARARLLAASGDAEPVGREGMVRRVLTQGRYMTPEQAAERIWALLPPDPDGPDVHVLGPGLADDLSVAGRA